ncbi:MAG: hypothetical protein AAF211_06070 [Myxococcota bacterium]
MSRPVLSARLLGLSLIPAFSSGCTPPVPLSDVILWVESTSDPTTTPCSVQTDHNFQDAVPVGQAGSAQLIASATRNDSAGGRYGYLTRQGGDGLLLNLAGEVYRGDFVDERTIEVSWSSSSEETSSIEFFESYRFEGAATSLVEDTVVLTAQDDAATLFGGTRTTREIRDVGYVESDQWSSSETSILFSSVPSAVWLEPDDGLGSVTNNPIREDCAESECRVVASSDCSTSLTLEASVVDGGLEGFLALDTYGREAGSPAPVPDP